MPNTVKPSVVPVFYNDSLLVICDVCGENFGKHSMSYNRCPTYAENGTRVKWATTSFVPRSERMVFNSTTEKVSNHD